MLHIYCREIFLALYQSGPLWPLPSLHRCLDQAELGDRVVPQVGDVQHRVLVEVVVEHDAGGPPQRAVQLHDAERFPLLAEEL